MNTPVIIEAALNGINGKDRNPNQPTTVDEIVADAVACVDAGATIIHAHHPLTREVEDLAAGRGEIGAESVSQGAAVEVSADIWSRVLAERPGTLFYPGLTRDDIEALHERVPMRLGVVDPGSLNVGATDADGLPAGPVYINTFEQIRGDFERCRRNRWGPTLAIFEPGFLRAVLAYHSAGWLPPGCMVKLYFGGPYGLFARGSRATFGLPPTATALDAYLELLEGTGLPWSVSVWGGDLMATPVATLAVARGGHLHVGLEEHFDERKPTNVELVEEAVALTTSCGRTVASADEAVAILGLPEGQ